jgi:hypothetical protein
LAASWLAASAGGAVWANADGPHAAMSTKHNEAEGTIECVRAKAILQILIVRIQSVCWRQ